MTRPNALTDELSDADKQRLSIQFASMRKLFGDFDARTQRLTGAPRGRSYWQ